MSARASYNRHQLANYTALAGDGQQRNKLAMRQAEGQSDSTSPMATVAPSPGAFPAAFSPVLVRLLGLLGREDAGIREVSEVISQDPALTARVLHVANSPLFGFSYQVRTVLQAVTLLGVERVKVLAFTVALYNYLGHSECHRLVKACWRHNLATAFAAERIALAWWLPPEESFLGGLLHEIGRLVLIRQHPDEYEHLVHYHDSLLADGLQEQERNRFGVTSAELTLQLLQQWRLPSVYVDVAQTMLSATLPEEMTVATAVYWASRLASVVGFTAPGCTADLPWEELVAEVPRWGVGKLQLTEEEFREEIALRINAIELAYAM